MNDNPSPQELSELQSIYNSNIGAQNNVPQGTSAPASNIFEKGLNNLGDAAGNSLNMVLGAGDALRNTLASTANLFPGINISMAQSGQGSAYDIGKFGGNIAAFLGGGELADTARLGAAGIPYLGRALSALSDSPGATGMSSWIPGVARRAIGSGMYGAATDQNNRIMGGALGLGLSPAADAVPGIAGKLSDAAQYFMPTKYMHGILQNLGGGQSLEDATKSVIQGVKTGYDNQTQAASDLYDPVYNAVRNSDIYNPIGAENGAYTNLPEDTSSSYTSALKNLHNQFLKDPTFDNAHQLQSQLGATLRKLQGGSSSPDISTINAIDSLSSARSAVKQDMNSFLSTQPDDLQSQYQKASDYFLNNVVPYRNNPKIYGMATGDITNIKPSSLGNIFSAPGDDMHQVLGDMSPDAISNLLYTKLGQRVPSMNADSFVRNYDALDQQGLGSYVSSDVQSQVDALKRRIFARNALQFVPGFVSGLKAGGGHGAVPGIGAAVAGAGVGKPIINYIQSRLPMEQIAQTLGNTASASYPALRTALLSNTLNNSGGQP